MGPRPALPLRPPPLPPEVVGRLRQWVRTCLALAEGETVTVTQLACRESGCAPIETVLAVLRPGAPVSRSLPLPAELVSVADVQRAFSAPSGTPERDR